MRTAGKATRGLSISIQARGPPTYKPIRAGCPPEYGASDRPGDRPCWYQGLVEHRPMQARGVYLAFWTSVVHPEVTVGTGRSFRFARQNEAARAADASRV
jgi:hypothetical protein